MATMDIFNGDGFSLTALNSTVDKVDYAPGMLAQFFVKEPTTQRAFWIDRREATLDLVPATPDGSPPIERQKDTRDMVNLHSVRLAKGRNVTAAEVAGLRAFGTESEQDQVMRVYDRYRGLVRSDIEATLELHRLGALQGRLYDADGRLHYNYFTQFGETEPASTNWNLTVNTFDPRDAAGKLKRLLLRKAKGLFGQNVQIVVLAGDNWFDALIGNAKLRETYLNISNRDSEMMRSNMAFDEITVSGVRFINYRGTDDNDEIAIGVNDAFAFVTGVGALVHAVTPSNEFIPFIGSFGQEFYAMNLRDPSGRDAFVKYEEYSYPLLLNKRPEATQRLGLGA